MADTNKIGWKDAGLDCLVLDEYLLPDPNKLTEISLNRDRQNENGDIKKVDETIPRTIEESDNRNVRMYVY